MAMSPSTPWLAEDRHYQDWLCELHHHGRYSRGQTGSHRYIFFKRIPRCHFVRFWCYSKFHQQGMHKCQLTIKHFITPYMISSPGGRIITNQLAKNTPLNLAGKVYKTGLIILEGQGLDVILGMSWMKEEKALLPE
jgi:hypothetical protein